MALAARWAWQCSPPLTVLAIAVQLTAGAVTAFGLLATADVFTQLLAQGPTPERVLAAVPAIALVVAAAATRGLLDAAVAAVTGSLIPRVEQRAQDLLHAAVVEVELAAFDDADFAELVDRATHHGLPRVRGAVRDSGDLLAGLVSLVAAVTTAGLLHPVLAPVVLVAALPQGWASVRAARMMFAAVVRMFSRNRRLGVTSRLITGRDEAAELRAFTAQQVLLGEHRRIADEITADSVRTEHHRTLVQLLGRTLAGIGTAPPTPCWRCCSTAGCCRSRWPGPPRWPCAPPARPSARWSSRPTASTRAASTSPSSAPVWATPPPGAAPRPPPACAATRSASS